jgi:hypothetical protein
MAGGRQTLGRYQLERVLGKGAMGIVYEALDPKLHRKVAIKTILISQLDEETAKAYSQERRGGERREIQRERFHTDHWVFDHRFNHNHYYPQFGYSIPVLPGGHIALTFRGNPFFFHSGVWYRRGGPGFVVVRPPVGIIVPILPPAYSTVVVGSVPYYYANDVYYVEAPGGYAVAEPPAGVAEAAAAPAAAPAPAVAGAAPSASATWYYCESSKTYYPYVSECKEGWRVVPATPPQAR